MTKLITFKAQSRHVWEVRERPVPASKILPEWYMDMPPYSSGTKFNLEPFPNVTVKKCFPVLDSLTSGYVVPLWSDIQVISKFNSHKLKWVTDQPVFDTWSPTQVSSFDLPEGFGDSVFKYLHGWVIKTPPGYSCLITHPFGYQNLPFRAVSGIVDTDTLDTDINTPIIFKKEFEGIIEKGTPMFQIIPFKRDNWKSEFELVDDETTFLNKERLYTKIVSSYGRNLRHLKTYK
jgi:hypothetical protein